MAGSLPGCLANHGLSMFDHGHPPWRFAAGKDLSLATLRADGTPKATVVSYVSDGLSIYIGCAADSQKAANLARDPRVSLTITLPARTCLAMCVCDQASSRT